MLAFVSIMRVVCGMLSGDICVAGHGAQEVCSCGRRLRLSMESAGLCGREPDYCSRALLRRRLGRLAQLLGKVLSRGIYETRGHVRSHTGSLSGKCIAYGRAKNMQPQAKLEVSQGGEAIVG